MLPAAQETEPEYTEKFQCTECGHTAIIPSMTIIVSQFFSGLIGGLITLFLFIEELSSLMKAFQFNVTEGMTRNVFLVSISTLFIFGFTFILYRAYRDYQIRRLYRA